LETEQKQNYSLYETVATTLNFTIYSCLLGNVYTRVCSKFCRRGRTKLYFHP